MSFRPQDFYLIIIKLALLITLVPAISGIIGGLFRLPAKRAFIIGICWWLLVEIAVFVERGGLLFWKELYYIVSERSVFATEVLIGLVGFLFSIALAGTVASAFAKLGNKIVGSKTKKAKAKC